MKFFKKLRALREADNAAIKNSEALLEETLRTEPEVEQGHKRALDRHRKATEQARLLKDADRRNHYSESLTLSMQGGTAS